MATLPPRMASSTRASSSEGTQLATSMTRMTMKSVLLDTAQIEAMTAPISREARVAPTPMPTVMREP